MHVFVTGSTGFIGSRVVDQCLAARHSVLGLTRSDEGVVALLAKGAKPLKDDSNDLPLMKTTAQSVDAVIHLAFHHDFSNYQASVQNDAALTTAFVEVRAHAPDVA